MTNPHQADGGSGQHSKTAAIFIVAPHAARNLDLNSKEQSTLKVFLKYLAATHTFTGQNGLFYWLSCSNDAVQA